MFFNRPNWRAMGLLAVVLSSVVLVVALAMAAYSWRFLSKAVRSDGKVVKLDERNGVYYPVYTFADSQGRSHTGYSSMGSSPPDYAVGDTIKVLFQPKHPTNTMVDDFVHLWLFPVAFGGAGLFWLVTGIFLIHRFPKPLATGC